MLDLCYLRKPLKVYWLRDITLSNNGQLEFMIASLSFYFMLILSPQLKRELTTIEILQYNYCLLSVSKVY